MSGEKDWKADQTGNRRADQTVDQTGHQTGNKTVYQTGSQTVNQSGNQRIAGTISFLDSFLRENLAELIMYIGFMFIFPGIFYFYNVRTDAVRYASLLAIVWFLIWEGSGFLKAKRRHEELLEIERKAPAELLGLPEAKTVIEKDYQRILEKVYHDKVETESAGREFRRETADYYGMWVHQIKTPIAALRVLLQSGIMTDGTDSGGPAEERFFSLTREMKQELFKIEQYVEMVLVYLRSSDMTSDFRFGQYDLDSIIRQAVKKYSQMFILQKVKLNYEPVKRAVVTDEKWLAFVIEQLLSNSLKYCQGAERSMGNSFHTHGSDEDRTGEDAQKDSISIYMEGECLVIEDTGIGIWAEDLPRVFEKGFTGYNGRENKKSTGIGLYLCRTVMDKLGHGIWLESEAGKGTKAYLDLGREGAKQNLTNM